MGQYKEKGYSLLGFLKVFEVLVLVGFSVVITWLHNYPELAPTLHVCSYIYDVNTTHYTHTIAYSSYNATTLIANMYTVFTTTVIAVHQCSFITCT